jgi:hypothetical protein
VILENGLGILEAEEFFYESRLDDIEDGRFNEELLIRLRLRGENLSAEIVEDLASETVRQNVRDILFTGIPGESAQRFGEEDQSPDPPLRGGK